MKPKFIYIFLLLVVSWGCAKRVVPGNTLNSTSIGGNVGESELEYQYTFTEANKQMLFGDIKQAVLLFKKCVNLDSTRAMPYYQLANIYYRAGDAKSALSFCEAAYKYEKENVWIVKLLVELYRLNDLTSKAIELVEVFIIDRPELIEFQYVLASLYHDSKKNKKALEVLNSIENRYGVSEQVSLSRHEIFAEIGKHNAAENELLKLIELNPGEYRFQGILAEFYSSIGENAKAEKIYKSLINVNTNNPLILLSAAEHYNKNKKYEEAKRLYEIALLDTDFEINNKIRTVISIITDEAFFNEQSLFIGDLINKIIDQQGEGIKLLTLRADFNIRIKNYEGAENDLIKVLEQDKGNLVIWEQFLFINNIQNDNETLLKYSQEALTIFPDQPNFYLFKGLAEMNLSKYDKSVQSFKTGLKLTENNQPLEIQFLTFLGDVYRNLGNNKKSDEYFENVLEKDPNNLIVLNNYSYYLSLREEKLDKAEKFSRRTLEKDPNNSTYLDTYAWVLFKLSKYDDARKYIEKAIDNNGSGNSEILEHYGDILEKLNDFSNAVVYWKLAIKKGGDKESIQKKIDNVGQNIK